MEYKGFEILVLVFTHIGFLVLGILIGKNLFKKKENNGNL